MAYIGTRFFLTQTCTIRRRTKSTDTLNRSTGGSYSNFATSVRCRLIVSSGKEIQDEKAITVSFLTLYLPFGQDVREDDQIILGSNTYLVGYVNLNPGSSSHHVEVNLTLVKAS